MGQGALGTAGVRRVWAVAGLQRAAYRAASRAACLFCLIPCSSRLFLRARQTFCVGIDRVRRRLGLWLTAVHNSVFGQCFEIYFTN